MSDKNILLNISVETEQETSEDTIYADVSQERLQASVTERNFGTILLDVFVREWRNDTVGD